MSNCLLLVLAALAAEPGVAPAKPGFARAEPWAAPIGIPAPEFGIAQIAPAANVWVDNTHPAATDADNPSGSLSRPRKTIPSTLAPGTVVEIRGGPYAYGSPGYIQITAQGTADRPVVIRGPTDVSPKPRFTQKLAVYTETGTPNAWLILEGLDLFRCEIIAPAHHVVLRDCEVRGDSNSGGVFVGSWSTLANSPGVSDVVILRCAIHHNGDWQADHDQDVHGVEVGARAARVWILDNRVHHNSGDGVQINAGSLERQPTTHHIYVGRNVAWENKQTGFWTKQAVDVVFSQNTAHHHYPVGASPSAWGAGMGYQYGPDRVWFIFNHIHDCAFGIQAMSTSGAGSGQNSYFVGNVIHNIHHGPEYPYDPASAWSNAGIMLVGTPNLWIVHNTIWDADAGIHGPASGAYHIENNLVGSITEPQGHHVLLEQASSASRIKSNLFAGDAVRVRGGPAIETGSVTADPLLAELRPGRGSPAIDVGAASEVYETFRSLYGLDIAVDAAGVQRPQGAGPDIGAFERVPDLGDPAGGPRTGDIDGDGDVDLHDMAVVLQNATGPRP